MEPEQEMIDDVNDWCVWLYEHKLRWLITPLLILVVVAYIGHCIEEEACK